VVRPVTVHQLAQVSSKVNGWVEVLAIYALIASTFAAGCWYMRR
jgi:hypothetical protein